ncbi:MAG: cob(I)yrinic acid a,c-diamide adenosyltransferase [Ekhidna sp.]|nr:cob(I)yrinic acid a,c-diamide adenosyltransferase [Ekhidna sp.]
MSAKLYTKTGDKGKTSLLGGKKVSKADLRIESYGNVDELNSFIGHLKDHDGVENRLKQQLYWIQEHLFSIGSILATESDFSGFELPTVTKTEVEQLEVWIDKFDKEVPSLKNFILPGGHPAVSLAHICRTVCRRTERSIISLNEHDEIDEAILQFMNRLSDYLFIFARAIGHILGVKEIPWAPGSD